MLGDNPDRSALIELYNPWTKDSKAYDHSLDPGFYHLRISWEDAVREGRTTLEFIESQRKEITPLEFTVLYESKFPDQSQDSIFDMNKVNNCIDKPDFDASWLIISCDVADKGLDKTVILVGKQSKDNGKYIVNQIISESVSENVHIAGTINGLIAKNRNFFDKITVYIDRIGVGTGVVSMVREFVLQNQLGVKVIGCHFGEKAKEDERFANKKAEKYFRLKDLFEGNMISIPKNKDLLRDLSLMSWKPSSKFKITIVDPDKSPDFADALVYFTWGEDVYSGGGYVSVG